MILHQFVSFVENLLYVRLKVFRSDGGGEFYNSTITHLFTTKGILHKKNLVPTLLKKMVSMRETIDTLLKLGLCFLALWLSS